MRAKKGDIVLVVERRSWVGISYSSSGSAYAYTFGVAVSTNREGKVTAWRKVGAELRGSKAKNKIERETVYVIPAKTINAPALLAALSERGNDSFDSLDEAKAFARQFQVSA